MTRSEALEKTKKIPLTETTRQFAEWLINDFGGILKYSDRVKIIRELSDCERGRTLQFTDEAKGGG